MVETRRRFRRQLLQAKSKKNFKAGVVDLLDGRCLRPADAVAERKPDPVRVHAPGTSIHLMLVTSWFLAGLVAAFAKGGHRASQARWPDAFILVGAIVMVQTVRRYTSRDVYWSVRDDRLSRPFFDW